MSSTTANNAQAAGSAGVRSSQPPPPDAGPNHGAVTSAMQAARDKRGPSPLTPQQRAKFEEYVYLDPVSYTSKMKELCKEFQDKSWSYHIIQLIEPLQAALTSVIGHAANDVQAAPIPVAPVLGGIMCIMDITQRYSKYQERIAKMLATMGQKAPLLVEFEQDIYREDPGVREALIDVYSDVIDFNEKCLQLMVNKRGQTRRHVKIWTLSVWKDFDYQLGPCVSKFQEHITKFEELALMIDKRRLRDIQSEQEDNVRQTSEMRSSLISTVHQGSQDIQVYMEEWEQRIDGRQRELARIKSRERTRAEVLKWLNPLSYKNDLYESGKDHLACTGEWLERSKRYQEWKSPEKSDLFWVTGKPGCGKSVLAALTIADLVILKTPRVAVAYVFCKPKLNDPRDSLTLLRGLLSQLCYQSEHIEETALELHEEIHNHQDPDWGTVSAATTASLNHFSQVYIIVDGLDECEDHRLLAEFLAESVKNATPTLKTIVFSRPHYEHIRNAFNDFGKPLEADTGANEEDIKTYIDSILVKANRQVKDEESRNEIKTILLPKADGMFLWVRLVAGTLEDQPSYGHMKKAIKEFPRGLNETYDECLKRIWKKSEAKRDLVFKALLWVFNAVRPLTELEMIEAIVVEPRSHALDEDFMVEEGELLEMCGDLLKENSEKELVFVHPSLQEYLQEPQRNPNEPFRIFCSLQNNAHRSLAEVCLTYLLFDKFKSGPISNVEEIEKFQKENTFHLYASLHWAKHVSRCETPPNDLISNLLFSEEPQKLAMQQYIGVLEKEFQQYTKSTALHFLAQYDLTATASVHPEIFVTHSTLDSLGYLPLDYALRLGGQQMALLLLAPTTSVEESTPPKLGRLSPLHVAIGRDWPDVLEQALLRGYDTELLTEDDCPPIIAAAELGRSSFLLRLLQAKAKPNVKNEKGDTVLILALYNDMAEVIKPLLEAGAEVEARGLYGQTALHAAAEQNNMDAVVMILNRGAYVSPKAAGCKNYTPLHYACQSDAATVLQYLLDKGASISEITTDGCTPLHVAAFEGSTRSAKVLLDAGADPNTVDRDGETCLHLAAASGHAKFLELICELPILSSIDSTNHSEETALHLAARKGSLDCVRILLAKGASVNKINHADKSPLIEAVILGHTEVVQFLLNHGADANVTDEKGVTPIAYAAHYGMVDCLEPLLHQGRANVEAVTSYGNSVLHIASSAGNTAFVEKLLDLCPSLNLDGLNVAGSSALFQAVNQGKLDTVTTLLARNAIALPDFDNELPIHGAASNGNIAILRLMLDESIINSRGREGRTPLWYAAANGHFAAVKVLADTKGCDIDAADEFGRTPLYMALVRNFVDIGNWLLDLKADVFTSTDTGFTLLHVAAEENQVQIAKRLLDADCDALAKSKSGRTPFFQAASRSNVQIISLFLERNFDGVNDDTFIGFTPLMAAATENGVELLDLLIRRGANPMQIMEMTGHTLFHHAAFNGALETCYFLKAKGLDPSIADRTSLTPIAAAALYRFPEIIELLVNWKVEIDVEDTVSGRTALLSAAATRASRSVGILLDAGANPQHRDRNGRNALDLALGHEKIVNLLLPKLDPSTCVGLEEQRRRHILPSIQKHLESLLSLENPLSARDLAQRLDEMSCLAPSLTYLGDPTFDDAASLCYSERYFRNEDGFGWDKTCSVCSNQTSSITYVCRTCDLTLLCESCYGVYDSENTFFKPGSAALKELATLEKSIQTIRHRAQKGMLFDPTCTIVGLDYFEMTKEWLNKKQVEYDKWSESYNAQGLFSLGGRPGEEFLGLFKEGAEVLRIMLDETVEDSKEQLIALQKRYKELNRRHPAGQEYQDSTCFGHSFLKISEETWKKAKGIHVASDSTGLLSNTWLQELLQRVKDCQEKAPQDSAQADPVPSTKPEGRAGKDLPMRLKNMTQKSDSQITIPARLRRAIVSFDEVDLPIVSTRSARGKLADPTRAESLRQATISAQSNQDLMLRRQTFPIAHGIMRIPRVNSLPLSKTPIDTTRPARSALQTQMSFPRITEEDFVDSPIVETSKEDEIDKSELQNIDSHTKDAEDNEEADSDEGRMSVMDLIDALMPEHLTLNLANEGQPQSDPQEIVYKMQVMHGISPTKAQRIERTVTLQYDDDDADDTFMLMGLAFTKDIDEDYPVKWARSKRADQIFEDLVKNDPDALRRMIEGIAED